jgi:hypothetical protein
VVIDGPLWPFFCIWHSSCSIANEHYVRGKRIYKYGFETKRLLAGLAG